VVTGEIGTAKREIAFLGDTVNTTARIEDVSRQFDSPLVASADLVERLKLPAEFRQRSLGKVRLRGKRAELELYAIERAVGAARANSGGLESAGD
jgi:adenylate cyclase